MLGCIATSSVVKEIPQLVLVARNYQVYLYDYDNQLIFICNSLQDST
jgi:hypothetical protein